MTEIKANGKMYKIQPNQIYYSECKACGQKLQFDLDLAQKQKSLCAICCTGEYTRQHNKFTLFFQVCTCQYEFCAFLKENQPLPTCTFPDKDKQKDKNKNNLSVQGQKFNKPEEQKSQQPQQKNEVKQENKQRKEEDELAYLLKPFSKEQFQHVKVSYEERLVYEKNKPIKKNVIQFDQLKCCSCKQTFPRIEDLYEQTDVYQIDELCQNKKCQKTNFFYIFIYEKGKAIGLALHYWLENPSPINQCAIFSDWLLKRNQDQLQQKQPRSTEANPQVKAPEQSQPKESTKPEKQIFQNLRISLIEEKPKPKSKSNSRQPYEFIQIEELECLNCFQKWGVEASNFTKINQQYIEIQLTCPNKKCKKINFIYTNGQELQAAAGWCMFSFQQLKNIESIFPKELNKWLKGTSTIQKEDEKSTRSEQLQQEQGIEQQDENQSKQQFEKTDQSQTESPNQIQIGIVDQKNLADQNSASKEEHDQIQGQDTQLSAEVNSEKKYRVNKGEQVHEQQQSSEQDKETSQGSGKQPGNLNTSDKSGDAVDEKIYPLNIQFCQNSGSASKISIDSFQCLQCQHNIEYVGPTENIKRTQNQGYISDSIKCRTCKTVHNLFVQLGELVNMKAFVSLQQLTKQKIQDWISKSQAIPVEKVATPKEEIITKYCDSKTITKKNVLQFPCIKCSQQVNHSLDKNYSEGQQIKAQCKSCKSELFIIQTQCHVTFISNKSILDLNDPVLCPNHCCYLNLKCQCQQFIGYLTIQDSLKLENKFFHTISCPNKQCKWKKIHYFKCELCKQKNLTEIILQFGAEPNFGAEIACSHSKFPHPIYVYAQCPSNDCGLVNFIKDYKMGELRKCAGSQCKQQFSLVTCQQCSQAIYLENQYEEMTLVECECGNQFTMFFCRGKDCCAPIQINELHKNSQIQKFYACSKCKEQNLLLFCANCDQHTIICKYDFKRQYRCANCKRQIGLKYSEQSQKIELISPFENDENPERPDYTQYGRMEEEDLPQNQGQYAGSKPFKSQSDNSYDPHQYQNYEGTWTGVHPGLEKMEMKNQAWGSKVI